MNETLKPINIIYFPADMKYLPYLAIALCFLLLLGYTRDLGKEVSELREEVGLLNKEIDVLWDYVEFNDESAERVIEKAEWVVDEVRAIVNVTYSRFIPIDGGWLAIREEESP